MLAFSGPKWLLLLLRDFLILFIKQMVNSRAKSNFSQGLNAIALSTEFDYALASGFTSCIA